MYQKSGYRNGAIGEPAPKIIKKPMISRIINIGISHHFFSFIANWIISLINCHIYTLISAKGLSEFIFDLSDN